MKKKYLKIAVPTIGEILDDYLELCEVFTIFTINDEFDIVQKEILYTPDGCDCRNNIPLIMQQKGVTIFLANKLPDHATGICSQYGIRVFTGYSGLVNEVINLYLKKERRVLWTTLKVLSGYIKDRN